MINKLEYSFDDEPVNKFSYDIQKKRIEVYFSDYFDVLKNEYFEIPCIFIIEDWKEAKSKVWNEEKLYPLNNHIGIFSMILHMEIKEGNLEMIVNTINDKYISLLFIKPVVSFKII